MRLLARAAAWWRRRHLLIAIHGRRGYAAGADCSAAGLAHRPRARAADSSDDDDSDDESETDSSDDESSEDESEGEEEAEDRKEEDEEEDEDEELEEEDEYDDDDDEDADVGVVDAAAVAAADAAAAAAAAAALADGSMPAAFAAKFKLAQALHDSNAARFAALRVAPPVVRHETFINPVWVASGALRFQVSEFVTSSPVAEYLALWAGSETICDIQDFFKAKMNCWPAAWKDLEQLNKEMLPAMAKFELLREDVRRVVVATNRFVRNFRSISVALTAMEGNAAGTPSIAAAVTERCAAIAATAHGDDDAIAQVQAMAHEAGVAPIEALASIRIGATHAHMQFLLAQLSSAGVSAPAFELLYQATVDGVTGADLMRKCKEKGGVLVLARAAVGGWLYGGYMDCGIAEKSKVRAAERSFVFSLTSPGGHLPTAWVRSLNVHGVWHHSAMYSLCWLGRLHASATSVLQWRADDKDQDRCYCGLRSRPGTAFTGSNQWEASEVLVFRV